MNDPPVIGKPAVGVVYHPEPIAVPVCPFLALRLQTFHDARPVIHVNMVYPEIFIVYKALRRISCDLFNGTAYKSDCEITVHLSRIGNNRQGFQKQGQMIGGLFECLLRPVTFHQFIQQGLIGPGEFRGSDFDALFQVLMHFQQQHFCFFPAADIFQSFDCSYQITG